ncbi:hypothetical protein B9479_005015 [Cryptococcus floricola]|uniref:Uncharacterized protein n=1 Tax=Cryptococcus floricola TaxID=2591691 RepID=A0A5D3AVT3_9TREE|nr:hypothetical protein B9479_005015 [Cryptococcus floricola]
MVSVCEHERPEASGLISTACDITHLPFPPEVTLLIYDYYTDVPLPGSREYTDLLCLDRTTFAKKISGLYEDVTLSSRNVEAFFRPWREWYGKALGPPEPWNFRRPVPSDMCHIRSFLANTPIRHLTFADTTSLTTTLQFYHDWQTSIWCKARLSSPHVSPGKIFLQLSRVSFLAPSLRQSSSDHGLWPNFGSLSTGLWRWVSTDSVSLQVPKEPLDRGVVRAMSEYLKWQEKAGFELLVLDCAVPRDLPWASIEERMSVKYIMKGRELEDRLGDKDSVARSHLSPRDATQRLMDLAERSLSSIPSISSSVL